MPVVQRRDARAVGVGTGTPGRSKRSLSAGASSSWPLPWLSADPRAAAAHDACPPRRLGGDALQGAGAQGCGAGAAPARGSGGCGPVDGAWVVVEPATTAQLSPLRRPLPAHRTAIQSRRTPAGRDRRLHRLPPVTGRTIPSAVLRRRDRTDPPDFTLHPTGDQQPRRPGAHRRLLPQQEHRRRSAARAAITKITGE